MLSEENEIAILELQQLVEKSRDLREEDFYTIFTIHEVQNISTAVNIITKLKKENEERDKQLDLIIEEFYKKMKISTNCYIQRKRGTEQCLNHKNCKECLKQYFEKLAKKENK